MRPILKIILHCSASLAGVNLTANDIRSYHCNPVRLGGRGWRNPGYHYVVRLNGQVEKLLDEPFVANGVKGHNAEAIHLCYIGGLDKRGKPHNTMTPAQRAAIVQMLTDLLRRYPDAHLYGHNDLAAKACPCYRVREEFPEFAHRCPPTH